jgi:beta-1,4-mannooligosaccharide/beta-1,4-mannosyl-N-acetylglucosamine phosphorylase
VNNVVFPCATLHDADTGRIAIYYGAADTYVGVAYTTVQEIMRHVIENSEVVGDDHESGR